MTSLYNIYTNTMRRITFEKNVMDRRKRGEEVFLPLYGEDEIRSASSKRKAKIIPFVIGENKPTVIICPGGGYEFVSINNEGYDFAKKFNGLGLNAFVVVYRVGKNARFPSPMEDLARAICFVKRNAEKYNIDAENFYLCGSSAGGHLCAYFGAKYKDFEKSYMGKNYDLRPKGIVLAYPVISLYKDTHEGSCRTLLGNHCTDEEKRAKSVELIADESYPPTFFWHFETDKTVPVSNSIRLDEKLSSLGVKHKFGRYPVGTHGIGLADGTTAEGWIYEADKFLRSI